MVYVTHAPSKGLIQVHSKEELLASFEAGESVLIGKYNQLISYSLAQALVILEKAAQVGVDDAWSTK